MVSHLFIHNGIVMVNLMQGVYGYYPKRYHQRQLGGYHMSRNNQRAGKTLSLLTQSQSQPQNF